ncbi:hypothetical protein MRX96_035439 [Rhipicephalus microplus]
MGQTSNGGCLYITAGPGSSSDATTPKATVRCGIFLDGRYGSDTAAKLMNPTVMLSHKGHVPNALGHRVDVRLENSRHVSRRVVRIFYRHEKGHLILPAARTRCSDPPRVPRGCFAKALKFLTSLPSREQRHNSCHQQPWNQEDPSPQCPSLPGRQAQPKPQEDSQR